jgi:hypothetical protein
MQRIALFFVVLFTFVANAQNNGAMSPARQMLSSPDAFADGHLTALDKQISLAEELKPPLRAVFFQEGKDLIAVLGDTSLSEMQKLILIRQIRVAARNRVWRLLTHGVVRRTPGHPPPAVLVTQAEPQPEMR